MMEQMSIFDAMPRIKNTEDSVFTGTRKMQVLSLFSGIGAFEKALDNLEIEYDLVGFCEIDKYAAKSYCAIHGTDESKNLGDITKVDETKIPKDIDLLTYGFPCQDISLAGKQKGLFNDDGTQTRSGLFFEALRIIEATKPKIAIAENVKNLVGKKFNAQFQVVLASLEAAGYNNYWAVLNSKEFGVPQNRERVFIVSIRNDIDTGKFEFPETFPLEKRLKDVLEEVVDEKYYLDGKFETITYVNEHYAILCGGAIGKMHDISRRVYNPEYVSPAIHTSGGGNQEPKVAVAMRGRYNKDGKIEQHLEVSDREYANTITTVQKDSLVGEPKIAKCIGGFGEKKSNGGQQWYQQDRIYMGDVALAHPASIPGGSYNYVIEEPNLRIRKLTPKECFRLMGFDDTDFEKAEAVNSNTQLYKQAGNSIVVQVIEHIFKALQKAMTV